MKKNIFLLYFLVIIFFGCNNESENEGPPVKKNSSHLESLNLKGKVKSISEFTFIAFEKNGKIIKGDEEWGLYSEFDFLKFNKVGNVIEGKNFRNEKEGLPELKWINNYNENEKLIEQNYYLPNGDTSSRYVFRYDENENLTEINWYLGKDSLLSRSVKKCNERGNMVEHFSYNSDGSLAGKRYFKYDKMDNLIEQLSYPADERFCMRETHKYDENGNEIELIKFNADSTKNTHTLFKYDNNKNIIEEKDSDNDDWIINFEYTYDNHLNWIKKIVFRNGKPVNILEREIEYFEE